MNITILYGTETGNAEMLAEDMGSELGSEHEVSVRNLDGFAPSEFDAEQFYLIVCSTYGDGELPASAQPFAKALEKDKPDLAAMRFAVFGMGDREYVDTYNFGSQTLAAMLSERGAKQIGDRLVHDASGADMPEDIALPWAQEIVMLAIRNMEDA